MDGWEVCSLYAISSTLLHPWPCFLNIEIDLDSILLTKGEYSQRQQKGGSALRIV